MEDLSDRELEKFLQGNVAAKLFCGFQLDEKNIPFYTFYKITEKNWNKGLIKNVFKSS